MNIDTTEKVMSFANFNVTYGLEEQPLLTYFNEIIFPAFSNKEHRETHNGYYYFDNIQIKELENEYVLVGNLIKVTEYNVRTVVKNDVLCENPSTVPTAPYSRFMIFLRNHRMVLIKNESNSPSLMSFQAQCRYVVGNYIREKNRTLSKQDRLPSARINILNMPLKSDVSNAVSSLAKIYSVTFRFFPLNNDIPASELFRAIDQYKGLVSSKTGNLVFNSPKNKEEITDLITESAALTKVTIKGKDYQGNTHTVKEDKISSDRRITIIGDVASDSDEKIYRAAKDSEEINITSEENLKLYNKVINKIRALLKQ